MADSGRERVTPERNPSGAEEAPKARPKAVKKLTIKQAEQLFRDSLTGIVGQSGLINVWVQGRPERAIWMLSPEEIDLEVKGLLDLCAAYPTLLVILSKAATSTALMQFAWIQFAIFRPRVVWLQQYLAAQAAQQQPGYQEPSAEQWTGEAVRNGHSSEGIPGFPATAQAG